MQQQVTNMPTYVQMHQRISSFLQSSSYAQLLQFSPSILNNLEIPSLSETSLLPTQTWILSWPPFSLFFQTANITFPCTSMGCNTFLQLQPNLCPSCCQSSPLPPLQDWTRSPSELEPSLTLSSPQSPGGCLAHRVLNQCLLSGWTKARRSMHRHLQGDSCQFQTP